MKLVISIVTYNNEVDINDCVESLLNSDVVQQDYKIEIINNHSNFNLHEQFRDKVTVLHNVLRPDWSTGHITKDYNSAIVRNFRNLNNPDIDWLITSQDDTMFKPNWFSKLMTITDKGYNFITDGPGESFMAFTAEAIKNVGLYDERFCCQASHEGDIFIRGIIWNGARTSINDPDHHRWYNPTTNNAVIRNNGIRTESDLTVVRMWNGPRIEEADRTRKPGSPMWVTPYCHRLFERKWGFRELDWNQDSQYPAGPLIETYMFYPFFERDLNDLQGKRYIITQTS